MTRLLRALDRHFFAPASLRDLGLLRIVLVASQLVYLLFGSALFFGTFGGPLRQQLMLARDTPEAYLPIPVLKVMMAPFGAWGTRPEPMFLELVWGLAMLSGIGALVGLYSRLSAFGLAWTSTLLVAHKYSYRESHHPEALLTIMLWVLAFAPVSAWSIDRLRARMNAAVSAMRFTPASADDDMSVFARWPFRVGQWLLVLAYLSAAMSKLSIGGADWFNGYTLMFYMLEDGTRYDVPLALWLADQRMLSQILAVGAVLFEATFVMAVIVPRTAWAYVLAGTLMHAGIYVTQRAPFFTFMALYVVFIESIRGSWRALRAWLARRAHGNATASVASAPVARPTLIYDGLCPLCIRSMTVLNALDPGDRIGHIDFEHDWNGAIGVAPGLEREPARHAIHLVTSQGRIVTGFEAFRTCARMLPILWPLVPLLHAPLMGSIGPRVYDIIAGRRQRAGCRDGTCGIAAVPGVPLRDR